jgi:hypothetical protein
MTDPAKSSRWHRLSTTEKLVSLVAGLFTVAVSIITLLNFLGPYPNASPSPSVSSQAPSPPSSSTSDVQTTTPTVVTREKYIDAVSQVCADAEAERQTLYQTHGGPPAQPPVGDVVEYIPWNRLYLAIYQRMLARWRSIEMPPQDQTTVKNLQSMLDRGLGEESQAIDSYNRGNWQMGNAHESRTHQILRSYDAIAPSYGLPNTCLT